MKRGHAACIARTTNAVEGWRFGLQALFLCHHPTLRTFVEGIEKNLQMQRASFLQGIAAHKLLSQSNAKNCKCALKTLLSVDRCLSRMISVYLRAIAHLSYS